ncbi:LacI family transcriptional regulator [Idiomarina fontislapidosi]|uniref:LacI family transcriptional regulator n=1 Tax=Idiomarina fontislapidosi TaxID=263723 RepID=A0A432Y9A4_9GAMM|nr:LacI family DNA-binding transcriptional regulator [Idiomarina fontislapidosi]PYE34477.1 LacI family transcriptional regulator [Idiomarina fontislapidosi]RUO57565.1 LacI family transcriptional regulator [Idiomarina fontislapidosi]
MATIYEVSKLAGVSLATVSRVINNNAPVREATRVKVLDAMDKLGYHPNSIAQSLASSRSNSIGIVVSELNGPFFGTLLSDIETAFRRAGKHVIIAAGHSDERLEKESIAFLKSRNCDALILHVEAVSDDYLRQLNESGTPFVILNRFVDSLSDRCVTLNNQHGGYLATQHLLRNGHRKIGYISGPMWKNDAEQRYLGHLRALAEYGIESKSSLFYEGDFHELGGVKGVAALLHADAEITAIVCANDEMAAGAVTTAREQGLTLPDDLSIVGFDNVNFSHYMYPKLTTIDYPIGGMGVMAARWVLKHIYQQKLDNIQTVFEPRVIERDSVHSI